MIKQLMIFFLFLSVACFGQEEKKGTIKVKKVEKTQSDSIQLTQIVGPDFEISQPLTIVEQMPTFPGGNVAMVQFIRDNLKYPNTGSQIQGTVYITFIVEMDGSLSEIKVLRGIPGCSACDQEALRVVKMMPKWNAGKQNGKTVRVQYNLPINFRLK